MAVRNSLSKSEIDLRTPEKDVESSINEENILQSLGRRLASTALRPKNMASSPPPRLDSTIDNCRPAGPESWVDEILKGPATLAAHVQQKKQEMQDMESGPADNISSPGKHSQSDLDGAGTVAGLDSVECRPAGPETWVDEILKGPATLAAHVQQKKQEMQDMESGPADNISSPGKHTQSVLEGAGAGEAGEITRYFASKCCDLNDLIQSINPGRESDKVQSPHMQARPLPTGPRPEFMTAGKSTNTNNEEEDEDRYNTTTVETTSADVHERGNNTFIVVPGRKSVMSQSIFEKCNPSTSSKRETVVVSPADLYTRQVRVGFCVILVLSLLAAAVLIYLVADVRDQVAAIRKHVDKGAQ